MIKIDVFSVVAHWCRLERGAFLTRNQLLPGQRYILIEDGRRPLYGKLPKKCKCKQTITIEQAVWMVDNGFAANLWKAKKKSVEVDFGFVWQPQQRQVPRIDLITMADIERAYIDKKKESIEYIEEVHQMHMEERAKMIVPFRPTDPWGNEWTDIQGFKDRADGRLLNPFPVEQRTAGGHHE